MNQEIEIKFGVQSEECLTALEDRAREMFPKSQLKQVQQTNYFFDTKDLAVRKQSIGVRLRKEDDRYFLTLKGPNATKKESTTTKVTQQLEFESELTTQQATVLLSAEQDPIWVAENLQNVKAR